MAQAKKLVVEFVLIFIAVTLSFFADDLRSRWGERDTERALLEAIRADILADLPTVENVRAIDSIAAFTAQWLHRNWDRPSLPMDSVAAALQPQYVGRIYNPIRSAYEGAKGSGQISYIRNAELRLLIGALYENKQKEEEGVNQLVLNSLLELHRALRPYVAFADSFPPLCCAPQVSVPVSWRQVQGDRTLRNTLLTSEMFRRLSAARLRSFRDTMTAIADRIATQLGAR